MPVQHGDPENVIICWRRKKAAKEALGAAKSRFTAMTYCVRPFNQHLKDAMSLERLFKGKGTRMQADISKHAASSAASLRGDTSLLRSGGRANTGIRRPLRTLIQGEGMH